MSSVSAQEHMLSAERHWLLLLIASAWTTASDDERINLSAVMDRRERRLGAFHLPEYHLVLKQHSTLIGNPFAIGDLQPN